ncbi:MAG: S-methyl-5'-thioadenosine phosphorylase [Phycisphaerales bacterium]|nr:S-methyl-5'-thioadenosine phosphorylase [Phycisphaerales bacterium]MCB9862437.1 S-methyl-5'-thioadenosine phosphorylase [Phycisphaerales bacterium]
MSKVVVGVIGGSGLGQALAAEFQGESLDVTTPFGKPSAPILRGRWNDTEVAFLPRHGVQHTISPSAVPYRANIYGLKQVGVTHIIASGATGSLREEIRPRDLVIPDQVIDRTTRRTSTFFDEPGVAAHVEFHEPFCSQMRRLLIEAGTGIGDSPVMDGGTYVCMEGPAFSTVAESRMHRSWGGDLIGMTCMPEAKLAREAEICYALLALPTDYDCWRPHPEGVDQRELLKEIIGNLEEATRRSVALIKAALKLASSSVNSSCPCQRALDLAVWTRVDHIPEEQRQRLSALLSRRLASAGQ